MQRGWNTGSRGQTFAVLIALLMTGPIQTPLGWATVAKVSSVQKPTVATKAYQAPRSPLDQVKSDYNLLLAFNQLYLNKDSVPTNSSEWQTAWAAFSKDATKTQQRIGLLAKASGLKNLFTGKPQNLVMNPTVGAADTVNFNTLYGTQFVYARPVSGSKAVASVVMTPAAEVEALFDAISEGFVLIPQKYSGFQVDGRRISMAADMLSLAGSDRKAAAFLDDFFGSTFNKGTPGLSLQSLRTAGNRKVLFDVVEIFFKGEYFLGDLRLWPQVIRSAAALYDSLKNDPKVNQLPGVNLAALALPPKTRAEKIKFLSYGDIATLARDYVLYQGILSNQDLLSSFNELFGTNISRSSKTFSQEDLKAIAAVSNAYQQPGWFGYRELTSINRRYLEGFDLGKAILTIKEAGAFYQFIKSDNERRALLSNLFGITLPSLGEVMNSQARNLLMNLAPLATVWEYRYGPPTQLMDPQRFIESLRTVYDFLKTAAEGDRLADLNAWAAINPPIETLPAIEGDSAVIRFSLSMTQINKVSNLITHPDWKTFNSDLEMAAVPAAFLKKIQTDPDLREMANHFYGMSLSKIAGMKPTEEDYQKLLAIAPESEEEQNALLGKISRAETLYRTWKKFNVDAGVPLSGELNDEARTLLFEKAEALQTAAADLKTALSADAKMQEYFRLFYNTTADPASASYDEKILFALMTYPNFDPRQFFTLLTDANTLYHAFADKTSPSRNYYLIVEPFIGTLVTSGGLMSEEGKKVILELAANPIFKTNGVLNAGKVVSTIWMAKNFLEAVATTEQLSSFNASFKTQISAQVKVKYEYNPKIINPGYLVASDLRLSENDRRIVFDLVNMPSWAEHDKTWSSGSWRNDYYMKFNKSNRYKSSLYKLTPVINVNTWRAMNLGQLAAEYRNFKAQK